MDNMMQFVLFVAIMWPFVGVAFLWYVNRLLNK